MPYKTKKLSKLILISMLSTILAACSLGPKGDNKMEKQAYIEGIRDASIEQLYSEIDGSEEQMANAAGYAVFSNIKAKVLWGGAASGHGIAVDNSTGKQVFMRMGEVQAGIGFGISDFRAVFIFKEQKTFDRFLKYGIDFSITADLTAQTDDKGESKTYGSDNTNSDPTIYKFTDSGVAIMATVNGTKYWVSPSLN